jgi:hypothetical protein
MLSGRAAELRVEAALLIVFSVAWVVVILVLLGRLPVAGTLHLDLYSLYAVAAALGWVTGNLYVLRRPRMPQGGYRLQALISYLLGPPAFVYLLRASAPPSVLQAAPLVPLYAFVVYWIFFLVPVTLRVTRVQRRR